MEAAPRALRCCCPGTRCSGRCGSRGAVEQVPATEADAYWAQRPRGSQLGAWASHQSQAIDSRAALDAQYAEIEERFDGRRCRARSSGADCGSARSAIEFWQGRANRYHDRILYTSAADGTWKRHRLQP